MTVDTYVVLVLLAACIAWALLHHVALQAYERDCRPQAPRIPAVMRLEHDNAVAGHELDCLLCHPRLGKTEPSEPVRTRATTSGRKSGRVRS